MTTRNNKKITISAPGKALITGGYLVLERPNAGLVLASTSRFYTTIQEECQAHKADLDNKEMSIAISSPQFHAEYRYILSLLRDNGDCLARIRLSPVATGKESEKEHRNQFLEDTLLLSLAFVYEHMQTEPETSSMNGLLFSAGNERHGLHLTLQADNDFYSQSEALAERGLPITLANLHALPRFMPCPIRNGKVHVAKTGMGSSAALVTSMVGAILHFFGLVKLPSSQGNPVDEGKFASGLGLVNRLAQVCHAMAQGKVGSGFDVSAAVYGSQIYRRFNPSILQPVLTLQGNSNSGKASCQEWEVILNKSAPMSPLYDFVSGEGSTTWDGQCQPFSLPPGFILMMGDVCGGSSTPLMVRNVLKWKEDGHQGQVPGTSFADHKALWDALARKNTEIEGHVKKLHALGNKVSAEYEQVIEAIAQQVPSLWASLCSSSSSLSVEHDISSSVLALRRSFLEARHLLKLMGEASGTCIEPDCQTELADATANLPGVLTAGVPGAGGYDAIFAIVVHEGARAEVEKLWCNWHQREGKATANDGADQVKSKVATLLGQASGSGPGDGIRCERPAEQEERD